MKMFTALCLAAALASAAFNPAIAQSTPNAAADSPADSPWVGVWQSTLDGQPGATLTLAQDTGMLGGTLVLDLVKKPLGGQAYVADSEVHTLLNPQLSGNTLTFTVKQIRQQGRLRTFTVVLTPEGKARIHCTDCGGDAPVVDMARSN